MKEKKKEKPVVCEVVDPVKHCRIYGEGHSVASSKKTGCCKAIHCRRGFCETRSHCCYLETGSGEKRSEVDNMV